MYLYFSDPQKGSHRYFEVQFSALSQSISSEKNVYFYFRQFRDICINSVWTALILLTWSHQYHWLHDVLFCPASRLLVELNSDLFRCFFVCFVFPPLLHARRSSELSIKACGYKIRKWEWVRHEWKPLFLLVAASRDSRVDVCCSLARTGQSENGSAPRAFTRFISVNIWGGCCGFDVLTDGCSSVCSVEQDQISGVLYLGSVFFKD